MATLTPFRGWRPAAGLADKVAAPPYDVLSSEEARALAGSNPLSFLHVGKSEIDLPPGTDLHSDSVYAKARENLDRLVSEGSLVQDAEECLYLYRQVMGARAQTGVLALASVDEYRSGKIKRHELTRVDKENDRARHIAQTGSHSGPAFFTYRAVREIDELVAKLTEAAPDADFTAPDGIRHSLWVVRRAAEVSALTLLFRDRVPEFYIADGHHRSAAAARVRDDMATKSLAPAKLAPYQGFLAVAFPDEQLRIMDYNRVVRDLNGLSPEAFLEKVKSFFDVRPLAAVEVPMPPEAKAWGMFLEGSWYRLQAKPGSWDPEDPIAALDVQILQERLLAPILGIADPRTDGRIDFVGGIRGSAELERRCRTDMKVAFQCYPTTVAELMRIADAGKIMPPKSTWFEPKLRDGMVIDLIR